MSRGIPLTDADRLPWLDAIRARMDDLIQRSESAVITSSALKESYRDRLGVDRPGVRLVHLTGGYDLILSRMQGREHFMPPDLLRSQFEALEAPRDALTVDITPPPEEIVATIRRELGV
jgi:gluconokinase